MNPNPNGAFPRLTWWQLNRRKIIAFVLPAVGVVGALAITTSCPSWPIFLQPLCPVAATVVRDFAREAGQPSHDGVPLGIPSCPDSFCDRLGDIGPGHGQNFPDGGYCLCPSTR